MWKFSDSKHVTIKEETMLESFQRILIIKWGALGDLIAGTVAIKAVRETFPKATITLLSNRLMMEVCPAGTLCDEIIIYDDKHFSLVEEIHIVNQIRKRKFDCAINLRWMSERSAVLCWLSGAHVRAGSGSAGALWFYTHKIPFPTTRRHEFLRHLDIVKTIGCSKNEPEPFVFISHDDSKFAEQWFEQNGLIKERTLHLHPGASSLSKAWMPERFAAIGKRFAEEIGGRVIITRGSNEQNLAEKVRDGIGTTTLIAPPTSVGQLSALVARAGLSICNYSGVMNVAMAVKTPLVALGCTSPEDWGPYGDLHRTINKASENDSYTDEQRIEMMKRISVDEVWNTLRQRWNELYQKNEATVQA